MIRKSLTSSARAFSVNATCACQVARPVPARMATRTAATAPRRSCCAATHFDTRYQLAVRPREHRVIVQVAVDVVGQRIDRGVAIVGPLLERLEHDRVEIAAQRASRMAGIARRGVARARRADAATSRVGARRPAARTEPRRSNTRRSQCRGLRPRSVPATHSPASEDARLRRQSAVPP